MNTVRLFASLVLLTAIAGCAADTAGSAAALAEGRPSFELSQSGGQTSFRFAAADGQTILSSQAYSSRTAALNGVLSVIDNGLYPALYQVVDTADGQAYFVLRAANSAIIGESDRFPSHDAASQGVEAAVESVGAYQDWLAGRTGRHFDVFRGADGRFYFNLHAGNGEIVLRSQGYLNEESAWNGCFSVSENGTDASRYVVRQAVNGQWYWNLVATNGQVIGTSEMYVSRYNAERARDGVITLLPTVEIL
jgi:uncharacterized protein